ncbi:MAG TPA: serine/threonine-protein kinase [Kofleriaceae bacterium]|jgi:serine/threonine-protein kinase
MSERFGSYEIYEKLGAGGLAAVHLARTRAVANPVALKRLFPHIAAVPELVGSFIDEARLAKYLRHPGIARVYEFGKLRGTYFIAFEFVPGPTLLQLSDRCAEYVGQMPVMVVLEILYQLCDALDHAHHLTNELGLPLGIVHRDVSPQNVIVSTTGQVKLIDFGLAKTKQSTVQSQAGIIKGKLNYVAPEYLKGKLDSRCDIWALGVLMYELLTGKRLFDDPEQHEILRRVQSMPIPAPSASNPEVSREVDELVLKALARDPEKRWQRAGDMRDEIGRVAAGRLTQRQFVSWVEWVFAQKEPLRREDSAVSALQEIMSHEIDVVGDLGALAEAMLARRRESVAAMPVGAAFLQRQQSRWWIWVAVLLALALLLIILLVVR